MKLNPKNYKVVSHVRPKPSPQNKTAIKKAIKKFVTEPKLYEEIVHHIQGLYPG